jgi:small-conductance mechanosensitive channel
LTINSTIEIAGVKVSLKPFVEVAITLIIAYIILIMIKAFLGQLKRREVISSLVAEQVYRLASLAIYSVTLVLVIYFFTSIQAIFYVILAVLVAVLLSNWHAIANLAAYYIILLSRELYKSSQMIEMPTLGVKGKINKLTPFVTEIKSSNNTIIHVPNYKFLTEPVIKYSTTYSTVSVTVEVDIPSSEDTLKTLRELEAQVKKSVEQSRAAVRPQEVSIELIKVKDKRALFRIKIPVSGPAPRPSTVNIIMMHVYNGLKDLNPLIRLE